MKNIDQLRNMFYNPEAYKVLPYKHNNFEDKQYRLTGFFVASFEFVALPGIIDERGVTNKEKAIEYRKSERNKLLQSPKNYIRECAEHCFTPEEAFALEGENTFDQALIAEQMAQVLMGVGPTIQHGTLEYTFKDGKVTDEMIEGVKFVPQPNGKVHVLEVPRLDNKQVPRNLYVAGIDGIDLGEEDTSDSYKDPSDFCVVIYRRAYGIHPPQIVAYYKDRPDKIKQAHIMCLRLLQWYNAQAVLESTRISLLQFFRSKQCENKYLMRRPRACQSDIQHGKSRQFGAPANQTTIEHYLDMISNYVDEYCGEIWFKEVLDELSRYSYENKRKFDIIAAFGMALLADEDLMFVKPETEISKEQFRDIGYWTDQYGRKHWGIIPSKEEQSIVGQPYIEKTQTDSYYGYERLRISSPRYD